MARIVWQKIKAATLLEVLSSIVIIMTVMAISTIVFVKVTGSSFTSEKMKSILLLKEYSMETQRNRSYFDEEISKDGILLTRRVDSYKGDPDLILLHLSAFDDNKKLLTERKEILLFENEKGKSF